MLSDKQINNLTQELHPCFAGYLHDGEVTERDALASIFQLFKNNNVRPIWENDFFSGKITGLKLTNKAPEEVFEQEIIKTLFRDKTEISIIQVTSFIKDGRLQEIINHAIENQYKKINNTITLQVGSEKIVNPSFTQINRFLPKINYSTNTVSGVQKSLENSILERLSFLGIIAIPFAIVLIIQLFKSRKFDIHNAEISGPISYLLGFFAILLSLMPMLWSKISTNFKLKGLKDPNIKNKMIYLFEFLSNHPINDHNFNNEFLPYSIALGIDNSWNKDFGLGEGVKLDKSALDIQQ